MRLEMYTVYAMCLQTGRLTKSNRLAVSVKDALFLERMEFGYPLFNVFDAHKMSEEN